MNTIRPLPTLDDIKRLAEELGVTFVTNRDSFDLDTSDPTTWELHGTYRSNQGGYNAAFSALVHLQENQRRSDPLAALSFEDELNPANWTEETRLHTPTFEVLLKPDGTLYLNGPALAEGFSANDAQALTRFLSERIALLPLEPPYDFKDFTPKPVEE